MKAIHFKWNQKYKELKKNKSTLPYGDNPVVPFHFTQILVITLLRPKLNGCSLTVGLFENNYTAAIRIDRRRESLEIIALSHFYAFFFEKVTPVFLIETRTILVDQVQFE